MLPFAIPGEDLVKNQISLKNIIAAKYLSAKENPKAYGKDWEELVLQLREMLRDPQVKLSLGDLEDEIVFSDLSLDVKQDNAKQIYSSFKLSPLTINFRTTKIAKIATITNTIRLKAEA